MCERDTNTERARPSSLALFLYVKNQDKEECKTLNEQAFAIFQITYSLVMTSFLGIIVALIKGHMSATKNGKQADMLLLRLALIETHDKAMAQGYITRYSFQMFNDTWRLYHDGYNGNTLTDKFREEILTLPIREE